MTISSLLTCTNNVCLKERSRYFFTLNSCGFLIKSFSIFQFLGISDSGYLSHATEDVTNNAYLSHEALSEQTINAMLKPHGFRGKIFIVIFTTIHVSTIHDSIRGVRIQLG